MSAEAKIKLSEIELPNQNLEDREIMVLLYKLTGHIYTFAVGDSMIWGMEGEAVFNDTPKNPVGFYQLMPDKLDEGFFDWYCYKREGHQFFDTKENAILHFIFYWLKWSTLGKPKPF